MHSPQMTTFAERWVPGAMLCWARCLHQIWSYISPAQGPQDGVHFPRKASFPWVDSVLQAQQQQWSLSPSLCWYHSFPTPIWVTSYSNTNTVVRSPLLSPSLTLRPALRGGMHPIFSAFAARFSTPYRLSFFYTNPTLQAYFRCFISHGVF